MKDRICINCQQILKAQKIKEDLTAMYCLNEKCPRYGLFTMLWDKTDGIILKDIDQL